MRANAFKFVYFQRKFFFNALICALFACKSIDFFRHLRTLVEKEKSLNFVRLLIFCAIVHHKRRLNLEFVIVIGAEGG